MIAASTMQERRPLSLNFVSVFNVCTFLKPQDLKAVEQVNRDFSEVVDVRWADFCVGLLNLPHGTNPRPLLPKRLSVKQTYHFLSKYPIFDERVYERHIGKVDRAPKGPKWYFLQKWNDPDSCLPASPIGREHVLMYVPEYITVNRSDVYLDKADDPNDEEAPRLIRRAADPDGGELGETTLKVAVTINNLRELFQHPITGNPSTYFLWDQIAIQHGNKRWPAGWVCMRKDVIGKKLLFAEQIKLAEEKGVIPTKLLHRILFNFLFNAQATYRNTYPDVRQQVFARTQTLVNDSKGNLCSAGCGTRDYSSLEVDTDFCLVLDRVGLAVELPSKIQAVGS